LVPGGPALWPGVSVGRFVQSAAANEPGPASLRPGTGRRVQPQVRRELPRSRPVISPAARGSEPGISPACRAPAQMRVRRRAVARSGPGLAVPGPNPPRVRRAPIPPTRGTTLARAPWTCGSPRLASRRFRHLVDGTVGHTTPGTRPAAPHFPAIDLAPRSSVAARSARPAPVTTPAAGDCGAAARILLSWALRKT